MYPNHSPRLLRRRLLRTLFALPLGLACAAHGPALAAQDWPAKPITLIVPYPAGGNSDTIARLVAENLRKQLGTDIIVENKGGAGATIGARAAASAAPDGYTLLLAPTAVMAITPHLRTVPYKPSEFAPVANVSGSYGIVAARKDLPANTMDELVELAKSQPGKLTFGSAGPATATHLAGVMVARAAGIDLMHVPYKGSIEALNDLLGGQIDLIFDPVALSQVKAGKLKALASSSQRRNPELPDVSTLKELGYDVDTRSWFGLFVPAGTPEPVIDKIATGLEAALAQPEITDVMLKFSQFPQFQGPEAFARRIADDDAFFKRLITDEGIKVE
ncbi:tripartite tricarboxylate transporter substrate binding protein [Verticiella sediminum]|uniref:Tripartite tricarboxylate transporter substrate binding protein n=1 Tax=Verticiella sediminum TaxID=1247510 RepID=A0A556AQ67_9BURK|nr:tripartite tricarboxylate transporter substrate binding protein [Verticiella sediminum]TSH95058.1 tripartite tricarboxylate transporter substrate binding protein [Verticiella sediminum]